MTIRGQNKQAGRKCFSNLLNEQGGKKSEKSKRAHALLLGTSEYLPWMVSSTIIQPKKVIPNAWSFTYFVGILVTWFWVLGTKLPKLAVMFIYFYKKSSSFLIWALIKCVSYVLRKVQNLFSLNCLKHWHWFVVSELNRTLEIIKKNFIPKISQSCCTVHNGCFWECLSKKNWRQILILGTNE